MRGRATVSRSPPSFSVCSPSIIHPHRSSVKPRHLPLSSSNLKLLSSKSPRTTFTCNCTRDSGENESKTIIDAFFLGKAVAEALNERIESAVGEFLSSIGRLQAEQQKQVQEFQGEVLKKARRAKEQAAREAMEAQGFIPRAKSSADEAPTVNGVVSNTSTSTSTSTDAVNSSTSSLQSKPFEREDDSPNDS